MVAKSKLPSPSQSPPSPSSPIKGEGKKENMKVSWEDVSYSAYDYACKEYPEEALLKLKLVNVK